MIPSWSWKTKVIHGTEHFSSLMDICMNSPGCLLEVDSFILPWHLSSVNWFHVLCIASSMISLFLYFWKKWSIFKWWDPYPTYPVRKTRSYSDGNFSCPPSLQISWLQLQAVMAKVKWEKPGVCGGESSYSELCLRTRVHLGGCCWFVKRHLARHHAAGLSLRPDFCVQHSSSGHWTGCRAGKSHQLSFVLGTQ